MRLSHHQVEIEPLAAMVTEACRLMQAREFAALAMQFGYAVALDRNPAEAIQEDLRAALVSLGNEAIDPTAPPLVEVDIFAPGQPVHALAKCRLGTVHGQQLLGEFVVTASGIDFHATLEQVSAAA